jgi:CRISPR-associated protein Cas1
MFDLEEPSGSVMEEDLLPPLTIDMVHQYAYCPRRMHLMYVDGRWDDNAFTEEGTSVHRRVDADEDPLPDPNPNDASEGDPPPVISRSVTLTDDALGLTGTLDLVQTADNTAIPVETKRGHPPDNPERSWEPQRVQLMAQALLLRAHGYTAPTGIIYFAGARQRVEVPLTAQLDDLTREIIRRARALMMRTNPPAPLDDSPKCNGCSLAGICLPDETNLLRSASREREQTPNQTQSLPDPRRLYPARDDAIPLYVQEQGAYVGKSGEHIVVKKTGQTLGRFLLKDISQVVLLGNLTITAPAIALLAEHSIPIVHLSRGWWFHAITAPNGPRNSYLRAAQFALVADSARSLDFARALVAAKARNQRTLLRRNAPASPELDAALEEINRLAERVSHASDSESLLGLEGMVARTYFGQFATMLKPEAVVAGFQFDHRNRRPPRDPVNACLSYLYALLVKECTVALMSEGFDPWWGIFHRPRHGKPSLALDLMEEFRPLIADSTLLTAVNTAMVQPQHFVTTNAGCSLDRDGRRALIKAYENRLDQLATHPLFDYRASWRTLIRLQARLLGKWLRGDIPAYTGITTR